MSLNAAPSSERVHIGIFGRRNAGKSSVINALTGQSLAIVSDIAGTTTDPVSKAMELLPLGPVVIIDTPGLDDEGELGKMRIEKSYNVLNKTDIALLVIDSSQGMTDADEKILERIKRKKIPYLKVMNKCDISAAGQEEPDTVYVSASTGENIYELKEKIGKLAPTEDTSKTLVGDLLEPNDTVVLVVPIDSSAPKGRLILPQQQVIRGVLEAGAVSVAVRETELESTLRGLGKKPKIVITDSQAFGIVSSVTPDDIPLTSFSILFARYKGNIEQAVRGAKALEALPEGAKILISEGCTHHRQCEDIGTVKLPKWIESFTGRKFSFEFSSGTEFPDDLTKYDLIVHCGGCMLNEREMKYRLGCARDAEIPMTNYGILIAHINGILERSLRQFPDLFKIVSEEQ